MTNSHMKRIRLNLARSKEFPSGSSRHGYEFVAPLDAKGHIDPHGWQTHRQNCGVRRFWEGKEDEIRRRVRRLGPAGRRRRRSRVSLWRAFLRAGRIRVDHR